MLTAVVAYVSTLIVFLGIDAVWLTTMNRLLYKPLLGDLLLDAPRLGPAAVFYALYIFGIVVFAVYPALGAGRWTTALVLGGLLGLVAYGTYDLTNAATLRGWSMTVVIADLCWGTLLTAVSAVGGYLITQQVTRTFG